MPHAYVLKRTHITHAHAYAIPIHAWEKVVHTNMLSPWLPHSTDFESLCGVMHTA